MSLMVFIFPNDIEFISGDGESQKISIFNPYDFAIHFYFKSTRPNAFLLSSTEGEILPKHSLEIVIDLLDKTLVEEKFQVKIFSASKEKKLGEKILKVTMKSNYSKETLQKNTSKIDYFQDLSQTSLINRKLSESKVNNIEKVPNQYFIYATLTICLILLLLPHENNPEAMFDLIQVTVNLKLVAAYILGIVTVFLIRS